MGNSAAFFASIPALTYSFSAMSYKPEHAKRFAAFNTFLVGRFHMIDGNIALARQLLRISHFT
jgi:hypothetical protein